MAKHNLSDSEDDLPSQSQGTSASAAKRARVSSLPPSSPPAHPSTTPEADALAEQNGEDGDDDEEEDDEMENAEDAAITQQANRLAKKNANADVGALAESGIIMRVELYNFMCHKLHTSDFGPRINFVVGNNGSGKSAILTGLSMALGGSAKGANRGKKGSDLVKEGEAYATCAVRIKNGGADAFQPNVYGKHITIERRINHDGGGGYKIKDQDEKVRSTKKGTLDEILDHFNIQVENPMTILTQDQARQFLNTSSSADKYNFFLRGTQLAQLTTEYEILRENTTSMQNNLDRKMGVVTELKAAYKRAKERGQEAQAAITQSERVVELRNELAWSYVFEDEATLAEALKILEKSKREGEKIQEKLTEYQAALLKAEDERAILEEAQLEGDLSTQEISARHEVKKAEAATVGEEIKGLMTNNRNVTSDIKRLEGQIADLLALLEVEEKKLARDFNAERQERENQRQHMADENEKLRIEIIKGQARISDIEEEAMKGKDEIKNAKASLTDVERSIGEAKARLATLDKSKTNPLLKYGGENVAKLVGLINREQGWIEKPIGPVGMLCKLKDGKFSDLLESVFAATLNAFVVKHPQDRERLNRLHKQANCNHNQPIIFQRDDPNFDFKRGEPPAGVLTILRVLEIETTYMKSVLINNKNIEGAALVVKRAEGDDLMANRPPNVQMCFSADLFRLGGVDGGAGSQSLTEWKGDRRLTADTTAERNRRLQQIEEAKGHLQHAQDAVKEIHQRLTAMQQEKMEVEKRKCNKHNLTMRNNNNAIAKLDDEMREEEPGNIAAVQEQLAEARANRDTTVEQYRVLQDAIKECKERTQPAMQARDDVKKELDAALKLAAKVLTKMEKNTGEQLTQSNNIKQYQIKLENCEKTVAGYIESADAFQKQLNVEIEQAAQVCEKRPTPTKKKTPAKIQQEIESIEKALKEREKRQGATVEQILDEVNNRKQIAEEAIKTCNEISGLIKALSEAYDQRIDRWTDFRDAIAHRAKLQFHYHLSRRNYTGKLSFNHEKQTLNLRVQIDPNAKKSDAKGLSGGEKSFSTICLLLTMWEAVGCPIRCLDEFDVFMDALNRRVSMKMMIDTAKAAVATQFILISPQSNNSGLDPSVVKVIKIKDPERSQGVLQFGR